MRLIDVTVPIHPEMLVYPGDPAMSITRTSDMARGASSNLSMVSMSTHTGTHVDPPIHFVEDGATIDDVPLGVLVGDATVVDVRGAEAIGAEQLGAMRLPLGVERLLFLTDWSARWAESSPSFPDRPTCVTVDGAAWLVDRGVRLVGTDFISIETADDPSFPVHRALLGANITVVEGLDLREVTPGRYGLWCLPLKIQGGDGGPARVVLVEE